MNYIEVEDWISVKDRLPDLGEEVLFFQPSHFVSTGIYSDFGTGFHFDDERKAEGVTHWIALRDLVLPINWRNNGRKTK